MNDSDIVDLYLCRDESAITESAAKYGSALRIMAERITDSAPDAEECENDTYLAAWNAIPPHEPRAYLFAFLGRITRHLALNRAMAGRASRRCPTSPLTDELAECLESDDSIERHLEDRAIAEAISEFLRGLDPVARWAFLRRYWYMEPIAVIAGSGGFTQAKITSVLHRTRGKLREFLKDRGIAL